MLIIDRATPFGRITAAVGLACLAGVVEPAVAADGCIETGAKRAENLMKLYRFVSLVAAVLVTVFLARFFTNEKVDDPQDHFHVAAREP